MKRTLAMAMLAATLAAPYAVPWAHADEGKNESAAREKSESVETQRKEEQRALDKYNSAVSKYGKDSTQAKKAWRRYVHEMKEHGHGSEVQTNSGSAPANK